MARKRTPTKDANSQNRQSKETTSSPREKSSSQQDEVKQPSRSGLRWSHLSIVTITMAVVTALVCYSLYPELTSITSLRRKVVPSLRKIIQPDGIPHVSKRDVDENLIGNVFQTSVESENIPSLLDSDNNPSLFDASDEEASRLAREIMKLNARKGQESENSKLPEGVEDQNKEPQESESNASTQPALPGIAHMKEINRDGDSSKDEHRQQSMRSHPDKRTLLSINSDIVSEDAFIENQDGDDKAQAMSSNNIKNTESTVVDVPRSTLSDRKTAGIHDNLPPRKGKSSKTEPIILSAEIPHISLSYADIQRDLSTQSQTEHHINENSQNSKQVKHDEVQSSSGKANSIKQKSGKVLKSNKVYKPRDNTDLAKVSKATGSEGVNKQSTRKQTNVKQDISPEESPVGPGASKSSEEKFKPSFQKTFTPKKTFYGGRRIAPVELLNQKPSNSSVKVFLFDDFLSQHECEGLMRAHNGHVAANTKPPILCFDSLNTLRKHIRDAGKKIRVTSNIFTEGTMCVNASFSLQMQNWLNSNWSYSTAFYPGESKFSTNIAARMERSMGLKPENGGKFQITSYPLGKAYKTHTDCTLGGQDKRDRVISVLMYLNDAEDGGETKFPDLGIWVKPKRGRMIVWNNMSPTGECEPHSRHAASLVRQGQKFILIRWYYYKSFPGLGQRPSSPELPPRDGDQAKVACDDYDNGSCRWYDEWTYEHLLEYRHNQLNLS